MAPQVGSTLNKNKKKQQPTRQSQKVILKQTNRKVRQTPSHQNSKVTNWENMTDKEIDDRIALLRAAMDRFTEAREAREAAAAAAKVEKMKQEQEQMRPERDKQEEVEMNDTDDLTSRIESWLDGVDRATRTVLWCVDVARQCAGAETEGASNQWSIGEVYPDFMV